MKIIKFLKDWTLIIAIITGIAAYFVYTAIPALQPTHHFALKAIELLQPMLAAILLRYLSPRLHFTISHYSDLSFYLWAVALTLAMTVTTRTIVHADVAIATELGLVAASFISCLLQFWLGRKVGALYNDKITAGQSLGQKNTVLAIWMGYTFFTPITAVAGGFYSIWHNVINSYQLYQHRKLEESKNENK